MMGDYTMTSDHDMDASGKSATNPSCTKNHEMTDTEMTAKTSKLTKSNKYANHATEVNISHLPSEFILSEADVQRRIKTCSDSEASILPHLLITNVKLGKPPQKGGFILNLEFNSNQRL
ncbi:hypothetical protein FQA39_LY19308 [Lamprigera yunnana]|nr:hypothetical protein FQA39_LY19308 [Lamprigera yunnana]